MSARGGADAGGSDGGTSSGDGGTTGDGGGWRRRRHGTDSDGGTTGADGGGGVADGGAVGDAGVGTPSSDCDVHCATNYTTCFENRCDGDAACVEERLQDCIARCELAPSVPARCKADHGAWRACVLASAGADDCPIDPCDDLSAELGRCISGGRECLGVTRWNHQKFDAFTDGDMLGRVWQSHCKCPTWPGEGEGGACGMVDEVVGPSAGGDCASI